MSLPPSGQNVAPSDSIGLFYNVKSGQSKSTTFGLQCKVLGQSGSPTAICADTIFSNQPVLYTPLTTLYASMGKTYTTNTVIASIGNWNTLRWAGTTATVTFDDGQSSWGLETLKSSDSSTSESSTNLALLLKAHADLAQSHFLLTKAFTTTSSSDDSSSEESHSLVADKEVFTAVTSTASPYVPPVIGDTGVQVGGNFTYSFAYKKTGNYGLIRLINPLTAVGNYATRRKDKSGWAVDKMNYGSVISGTTGKTPQFTDNPREILPLDNNLDVDWDSNVILAKGKKTAFVVVYANLKKNGDIISIRSKGISYGYTVADDGRSTVYGPVTFTIQSPQKNAINVFAQENYSFV